MCAESASPGSEKSDYPGFLFAAVVMVLVAIFEVGVWTAVDVLNVADKQTPVSILHLNAIGLGIIVGAWLAAGVYELGRRHGR